MRHYTRTSIVINALVVGMGGLVLAAEPQEPATPQTPPLPAGNTMESEDSELIRAGDTTVKFFGDAGAMYQFETDVDGDKTMSVSRLTAGFDAKTKLNDDLGLGFRLNYGFDSFDFDGGTFGTTSTPDPEDPWGDIHTIEFGMVVNLDLTDELGVFGGPVFKFARESGADWGDSFTGGGVIGASYQFNSDLVVGGGLGFVSQIEDDIRVFPIIVVEWAFADDWRISSRSFDQANFANGIELVYTASKDWELAVGGGFRQARFRLDDSGLAPDGVGEDESLPVWFRASWNTTPNVRLSGLVGMVTGGELKLEDDDGDNIDTVDYDATWVLGIFGKISF